MALPIHKDKGGRWRAYVTQKDEDEHLMEQVLLNDDSFALNSIRRTTRGTVCNTALAGR